MSNKKPQWLLDAEKAAQEFNESEAAKMTDGRIAQRAALKSTVTEWAQSEEGRKNMSEVGKSGKGAEAAAKWREANYEEFLKNSVRGGKTMGDLYAKKLREGDPKALDTFKKFQKAGCEAAVKAGAPSKAGKASAIARQERALKKWNEIYQGLPTEFTRKDLLNVTTASVANRISNKFTHCVEKRGSNQNRTFVKLKDTLYYE